MSWTGEIEVDCSADVLAPLASHANASACPLGYAQRIELGAVDQGSVSMNASPRWKRKPEGSTWGDFGPDDQFGRLNLLTPEKVKQGIAEVREGISFCLSLPLDYPGGSVLNPRRHPPVLRPTLRSKRPNMNYRLALDDPNFTDVVSDDVAILHLQYSTQWDSLAHVGSLFDADRDESPEAVYSSGFGADEHIVGPADVKDAGGIDLVEAKSTSQARALGVENMAQKCVQGRGVMIDLFAHVGREHALIEYEEVMRIVDDDKVEVEQGHMVLMHSSCHEVSLETRREHALDARRAGSAVPAEILRGAHRPRSTAARLDHPERPLRARLGQLRGRGVSVGASRRLLRRAAAARALPVQARRQPRRAVAALAARALATRAQALPLPAHRAAAPPAGRGRLARDPGRDGLTKAPGVPT